MLFGRFAGHYYYYYYWPLVSAITNNQWNSHHPPQQKLNSNTSRSNNKLTIVFAFCGHTFPSGGHCLAVVYVSSLCTSWLSNSIGPAKIMTFGSRGGGVVRQQSSKRWHFNIRNCFHWREIPGGTWVNKVLVFVILSINSLLNSIKLWYWFLLHPSNYSPSHLMDRLSGHKILVL